MEETTPVVETPVVPPVVETPAPVAPPATDLRATIKHAMDTVKPRNEHSRFQPRDNGKFAGAPQFPTPGTPAQATAVPVVVPPVRPDMPKSLKLDLKPHWETAHPDLAAAIVQREADSAKGIEPLKAKATQLDAILEQFRPYEMLMRSEGATPETAIGPLLQTAAIFRMGTPYEKATSVANLMRQFGIPIEHLQQVLSGAAPPQQAFDPAQLQALTHRVDKITQLQEWQLRAAESRRLAAVETFAADPANKHFEAVAPKMMAFLQSPQSLGIDLSKTGEAEALKLAYDAACYADPDIRVQLVAHQQAEERMKQQLEKAKKANVQISGAPTSMPAAKPDPNNLRDVVRNAIEAHR